MTYFPSVLCLSVHFVLKKRNDTEGRELANRRILSLQSIDLPHTAFQRNAEHGMTGKG